MAQISTWSSVWWRSKLGYSQAMLGTSAIVILLLLATTKFKVWTRLKNLIEYVLWNSQPVHEHEDDFQENEALLSLSRVSGNTVPSQREERERVPAEFYQFIRDRVLASFKAHRHRENGILQFAVLSLVDDYISCLADINQMKFEPLDSSGQPCVNPSYTMYPSRQTYKNYVVARPFDYQVRNRLFPLFSYTKYIHAESMILKEYDILVNAYREKTQSSNPGHIILFSWLFPCTKCTSEIIQIWNRKFREENPSIKRIVIVFKMYWRRVSPEVSERNRQWLLREGIDVVRVKYEEDAS